MIRIFRHYHPRPVHSPALSLRGLGVHELMEPGLVRRARGIDCHLFLYFYDTVTHEGPRGEESYAPGTFLLIPPREPHAFGSERHAWDHSWLLAGGRALSAALREQQIPLGIPLRIPVAAMLEKTLLEVHQEVTRPPPAHPGYVRNLLHNLIIALGRQIRAGRTGRPIPPPFLALRAYLEAHYTEPLSLGQLAQRVHLSVPRFATRFKELFGTAPIEYQIRLRMERASFLLHDSGLNIGEVARAAGYPDLHYFSRLFRKRMGITPSQMRRRLWGQEP